MSGWSQASWGVLGSTWLPTAGSRRGFKPLLCVGMLEGGWGGGDIPLLTRSGLRVSAELSDLLNLGVFP